MEHIKIQISTSSGTRTMFVPQANDWWAFLQVLPKICPGVAPSEGAFATSLPKGLRVYWIDEDSDKIDIVDDDSYHYFIALAKPAKKKLYVEVEEVQTPESSRSAPRSEAGTPQGAARNPELQVHENVECDGCDKSPIVGFRYKCVQCVDYDLCADCEAKGKHSEHVMFRLPTSVESVSFDRQTWKRMKRGCSMRPEGDEGTSRRHGHGHGPGPGHGPGHGHGHGYKHRPNIFSSLYTMMHDMAEGTEGPVQDDPENTASGGERRKRKEERKSRKCHQKDVPIIPIDPTYVKAGVQILNNLNEMFVNMLNPTVVPDTNDPATNRETAGSSGGGTTAKTQEKKSDAPKGNETAPTTSSGEKSSTRKEASTTDAPSAPMEQDLYVNSSESSDSDPEVVDMDPKAGEQNKTAQPEPASAKQPQQPEPPIVYHKDPAINRAVHVMVGMGFSNEGNWLSQLLEAVNGNISQALDLLKPVK